MSTPPDISSGSASGSGSDEQLDLAQASASRLGLPLQRPSLGSTPSTEPLISPGDISPSTTPVHNPFNAATAGQGRGSASQAKGLTVNVGGGGSANPFGGSNRSSRSSISNPSPTAPKIRINDMPNSPPSEDVSQAPTPPAVPDAGPAPAGQGLTSPFNRSSNLRNSINSIPASPTNKRASNGSTTSVLGGGAAVVTASGVEVGSGKNNIAARRALRMKQAQSTDSKGGNRYSNYTQPNKNAGLNRKAFQSTRLKGEIYKPWLEQKDPALRWARWITIGSIVMGFAIAAVICWDGYRSVPKLGKVCNLINEDFSSGSIDSSIFQHEVRLDGYGYGSFQWTTNDAKNSYVKDGVLYIVPTLTSDDIGVDAITNGHTVNLTADGTCTSTNVSNCVAVSNSSQLTIINPVKTARLITKNSHSIKYGKVEVKAKFPTGDWLWPRISMLPVNNTYGAWPRSGQINILGGRGNNATYDARGVDYAQSDLHWGPTVDLDRQYLTWGYREQRRTYYSQKYHTFGLEWNDQFMWTYIDSRVAQVISYRFNKESFWSRGKFPTTYTNNTEVIKLINPWLASSENNAPFDQPFYLMIDLAVGSQDGWFPDGTGGKPWIDQSGSAMSDFWAAKSKWWDSSWTAKGAKDEDRAFAIESVKMWEKC
ncbi:hypothetical protein I302_106900 [Kwoniella bestiolae CBS 10118]|uniref:GH16 domain-containing protein n=1 Tax=Kwoniella bestiolae CBS 10118 TaxID=1296100 RepID=A0A1B9G025_9TREE|nr:hypothetical protein I302_05834 [Kwoniella bestiolae CBS 10118]OCF24374.1 hypothetical protein I302_05834 [Kwoniella bestiolae CBS 10118]